MRKIFFLFLLVASLEAKAQDPQFSQYYAISCYNNPALAGNIANMRFGLQYRRQWLGMESSFSTALVDFEIYKKKINSGFAMVYMQDVKAKVFTTNTVHLMYSKQLKIAYKTYLRFGLDVAYQNEVLDKSKLTFVDQFTDRGIIVGSTGEPINKLSSSFPLFGAGIIVSGTKYFFGGSLHNANQPVESFYRSSSDSKISMKMSVNCGLNFRLFTPKGGFEGKPYRNGGIAPAATITTAFNFKKQGNSEQFDAGVYVNYFPLTMGVWYRGIPILAKVEGAGNNNDAIIFIIGVNVDNYKIGYSYDFTVSDLFGTSLGSHEISILYDIPSRSKGTQKTSWSSPPVSCPAF